MFTRTEDTASLRRGRRLARPLVVAVLCAAVVGVAPATAQAQTLTDPDTAGDMVRFNDRNDTVVPAPTRRLNDVTSTRLTHGTRRVSIRVEYVDLKRRGDVQGLYIPMVTNEGKRRYLQLVAYPRHWSGETDLVTGNFREVRCGGVRHTINYDTNVMRVSFPRRCASSPRWVKFRAVAYAQADGGLYADDALSDLPITSQDDNDLTWSPRIHRQAG
jgi:hypothetical protein